MEINSSIADNLFSVASLQTSGLENLANAALQRGIDSYTDGDYEGAVNNFKRAVGLGRNSTYGVESAQYLAMSYLQLEDTDNAIKAYQTAIQIDPSRDDSHVKLGNLYFSQEKYEEARAEYAEATRLNPSLVNRYSLGQAYVELGRYEDAQNQFNEIQRLSPQEAGGYLGMGLTFSRQRRYEDAIGQFEEAISKNSTLYDAYAQIGYAYADMGDMENAQKMVDYLEKVEQTDVADTLSRYMYKVDPPKMVFGHSSSTFLFSMGTGTPLVALNSYLMNADSSKTFAMTIQFDKAMDRESVEDPFNWQIGRAAGQGPGQSYNFGLRIPATEVKLKAIPDAVTYDPENLTATVYFTIKQNAAANGTIDPSHIEFKFSGTDIYGQKMNPKFDQFSGFNDVA
jgi:tetratricopeptide (TPR) repeat protein